MSELYAVILNNVLKGVEVSEGAALSLAKQLASVSSPIITDNGGLLSDFSGNPMYPLPPETLILKVAFSADDSDVDEFSLRGGSKYHMATDMHTRVTKLIKDDVPFSAAESYLNQVAGTELITALKEKAALESAVALVSDHFDVDNAELETQINLFTSILNFKFLQGLLDPEKIILKETFTLILSNKNKVPFDGVLLAEAPVVPIKALGIPQTEVTADPNGLSLAENVSVELTTLQYSIKAGISTDVTIGEFSFDFVEWNTEIWKDGLIHSNITNPERIEIAKTGRYLIVVNLEWESTHANSIRIQRHNSSTSILDIIAVASAANSRTDTVIIEADATDYVTIKAFHGLLGGMDLFTGSSTSICIHYLG